MGFETPNFETQEESYSSEEEAKKALEIAVEMDDAAKADSALKAMEALKQAKKDKLPEDLFNAMKDVREEVESSNSVNFEVIKDDEINELLRNGIKTSESKPENEVGFEVVDNHDISKIVENFGKKESLVSKFEKVLINGLEVMLSTKISKPITYDEAKKWSEAEGGRLPTIEELMALYESNKAGSFEGKEIWSSSMKFNSPQVFDFKDGRVELRSREDEIHATRAIADIN
jgi:hypothetical protein